MDCIYYVYNYWGGGCVYIAHNQLYNPQLLLFLKLGFFIQFYQLGILYKTFIEKYEKKCGMLIILTCILINIAFSFFYGEKISFNSCAFMESFQSNNCFLPLMTSITGIFFWTILCGFFEPIFATNKVVNFISENTFFIMANHLFFYNILNWFFCIFNADEFDIYMFKTTAWYKYMPIQQFGILYILFAIVCTFVIKYIIKKFTMK